ncbi:MAG: hypothetical protein J7598_03565 [Mitsuaria chitosanitabida]|uniref:hypothetical protein n=1 Tax=Roseateles chitosanitabidus TaxID=65048 RepID=UPI001B04EB53|nr:hypothetical protein [Roseateles chitosanitabidus]MBO9685668.1 hypothetical protein [Roseateles chitosanitabidus]
MELPAIIKRLTDAGARRAAQLKDLRQKRADHEGEYLAAISADDDASAAKARTKITKLDDEIREKEAAIEAASRIAAQAEADAVEAGRAALRERHDKDVQALIARAIELDELVNGQVADMWRDVDRLFTKARLSGQDARVSFIDMHGTRPDALWRRIWLRFTQRAGRTFHDLGGARDSIVLKSIADYFPAEDRHG